jgi:gliding motility-associated protein GldM
MKDGVAKYEVTASGEGNKKVEGSIMVKDPVTGGMKPLKFSTEYQVFRGSAVISADAMNVLYIGLDNPLSVSVPGFPPDKIRVTMQGATFSGGKGKYVVKPVNDLNVRKCVVNVSVETDKGKAQQMGAMEFRIKTVPKPVIKFGSLDGGKQSKPNLSVQSSILAILDGFVFEGVKYQVQEYKWLYFAKSKGSAGITEKLATGKAIPSELKGLIEGGRGGDLLVISQIKVLGPDGMSKTISSGPTIFVQ